MKIKNTLKKAISFLVILALVLSLIPEGSIKAATEKVTVTYYINNTLVKKEEVEAGERVLLATQMSSYQLSDNTGTRRVYIEDCMDTNKYFIRGWITDGETIADNTYGYGYLREGYKVSKDTRFDAYLDTYKHQYQYQDCKADYLRHDVEFTLDSRKKEITLRKGDERPGYNFLGWTTNSEGTGTLYKEGDKFLISIVAEGAIYRSWGQHWFLNNDEALVKFYPQYEAIIYDVTFDANGGSGGVEKLEISAADTLDFSKYTMPTKENYTLQGWTNLTENEYYAITETSVPITQDSKFCAYWKPTKYTIHFTDIDGNTIEKFEDITGDIETTTIIPFNTPKKTGYKFVSWIDKSTGETYNKGEKINLSKDLNLTPVWEQCPTVVIDAGVDGEIINGTATGSAVYTNNTTPLYEETTLTVYPKNGDSILSGWETTGNITYKYDATKNTLTFTPNSYNCSIKATWIEPTPTVAPTVEPTKTPEVKPSETPENKETSTPTIEPTKTPEVITNTSATEVPKETASATPTITPTPEVTSTPTQAPVNVSEQPVQDSTINTQTAGTITLGVGESYTLKCNGANKKFTTDNTNVIVSSTGKVKAVSVGTSIITVTTDTGVNIYTVIIKKAPNKLSASCKKKTLKKGKTYTIKAMFANGCYSNKITFSSNKKKIASVSSTGIIKALKKGTAIITLKTFNNKKVRVKITVK